MTQSLLAAALVGDEASGERLCSDAEPADSVRDRAAQEGVLPLLHQALSGIRPEGGPPCPLAAALKRDVLSAAAVELMWEHEIKRVLEVLYQGAVPVLILKGSALAYSLYPQAYLRSRCDTDLLVPAEHRDEALTRLEGLGYRRQEGITGELVSTQASLVRGSRAGAGLCIDLHWRLNNSPILSNALEQEEAASRAVSLPALGPHARGLCPEHALLLACMHRAGHMQASRVLDGETFREGDRLIWLYDIHLLVGSLSVDRLATFARFAAERKMAEVCRDALLAARSRFSTTLPEPVMQLLSGPRGEPSARYLSSGAYGVASAELGSLAWSKRLRLLREHLIPPVEYMRWKYGVNNDIVLPVLYCHRALKGLWKRLVAP